MLVEYAISASGGRRGSYNAEGVPLPSPTFAGVQSVMQFRTLVARSVANDDAFIATVRGEFPNVLAHQQLPVETPAVTPHLVLSSTSSQLAVSQLQADFQVRFYGDYASDLDRALEYVERKLTAILAGLAAIGVEPTTVGVIGTLDFSFQGREGESPAAHVLRNHLRADVDADDLQDAMARIAVRIRDTYFVTLTLSNYETRVLEQAVFPGARASVQFRPWEGRLDDFGVQLAIDINNNLEARTSDEPPIVTERGIGVITRLLREVATSAGPRFAETAEVSVDELTRTTVS